MLQETARAAMLEALERQRRDYLREGEVTVAVRIDRSTAPSACSSVTRTPSSTR